MEEVGDSRSPLPQLVTLGDGAKPYLFRLEPGEHTITLSVTTERCGP